MALLQPRRRTAAFAGALALTALAGGVVWRRHATPFAQAAMVLSAAASSSAPPLAAPPPGESTPDDLVPNRPLVDLGRALFFDPNLSEPPGTSCASCHDPELAFSGDNGSGLGVARGSRAHHFARRSTPSLLYLRYVPKLHFALDDDDALVPVPLGGFFWDGREDGIARLVRQPLLNPDEMNNEGGATLAEKLRRASYAADFRRAFPGQLSAERALSAIGDALQAFLTADEMAPFSSKFDMYVRGRAKLNAFEREGMRLFKDPAKGGCVGCHRFYDTGRDPALSMFTDYGYDALAVPRNSALLRDRKPDLGLCERKDTLNPTSAAEYCVRFRTPSLRNVAIRRSYMHNGAFKSLRDVVAFYATRATDPMRWYKTRVKFEDVPPAYRSQINVTSIPYNRREGDTPALDGHEIDAIVAFLNTLTDARYVKRSGR